MTPLDINPALAETAGDELALTTSADMERLSGGIAVTDRASLERAVADRLVLDAMADKVREFFKPLKDAAYKLHRTLCDREHRVLDPILALDKAKLEAISDYEQIESRRRRHQEQALAEEQKREADAAALKEAAALEAQGDHGLAAAVVAEAVARPAPVVVLRDEVREVAKFHSLRSVQSHPAGIESNRKAAYAHQR